MILLNKKSGWVFYTPFNPPLKNVEKSRRPWFLSAQFHAMRTRHRFALYTRQAANCGRVICS
jgi:hypothetical protein